MTKMTTDRRAGSLLAAALGAASLVTGSLALGLTTPAGAAPAPAAGRVARQPAAARVGSVPALPSGTREVGALPASTRIGATVVLAPRDPAALADYATAVSTPGSPHYHRYLSTTQFAARFGPSAATLAAVRRVLSTDGLRPAAPSPNHLSIGIDGDAGQLSKAFATSFARYAVPDGRTARMAFAATRAPLIPGPIAGAVQGVVGLDDVARLEPLGLVRPTRVTTGRAGGRVAPHVAAAPGGPQPCSAAVSTEQEYNQGDGVDEHTYDQLASAYGFSSLYSAGDLGAGQTVAVYELEPDLPSDVAAFQSCYGTHTTVDYTPVDGGVSAGAGSGEAALDIDNIIGLAPSATVDVYQAPNGGQGPYLEYAAIIDADTAKIISTSWGSCESQLGSGYIHDESTLFEQAAVQGQTVVAAAGDDGSEDCGTTLGVDDPASQPDVTGVGGTSLDSVGPPPSETAWNESALAAGAGGGGLSAQWAMPAYQADAPGSLDVANADSSPTPCASTSADCREVPDVSADGDPETGYLIYYNGSWTPIGGTSAAAPLWASFVALTDASAACAGTGIGFANPALYAIAGRAEATDFHDVTTGNNDYTGTNNGLYPAGAGYDMATGLGTPNGATLPAALCDAGSTSVPAAPTGVQAAPGNGRVTLSWTAPASDGGSDVTGYDLYEGTSSNGESAKPVNATPLTTTSDTVTGLTDGTTYYFTVKAINDIGPGPASAEVSATPVTVPTAPQAPQAVAGPGQVSLTWQAPASDGGSLVTGYEVFEGTSTGAESSTPVNTSPLTTTSDTVTGLTNGTTYFFTVEAVTAVGAGAPSAEVSATPVTVATAPQAPQAAAGPGQVTLLWAPPASDGGSAVTGYEVFEGTPSGGEGAAPVNASPLTTTSDTVTGLTNGTTYFFTVEAVNAVGAGAPSAEVSATPAAAVTAPGAPTAVQAAGGAGQVSLSWEAPASDGGSVVTGYEVFEGTSSGGEGVTPVNASPLTTTGDTVTGLTNGTRYFFTVEAVNAVGAGAPSSEVSATPVTVPLAPQASQAAAGPGQVTLSWQAPASDGGSPVTGYEVFEGTAPGGEGATAVNATPLTTTSDTVTGLTNGTRYFFTVEAVNAAGAGGPSAEVSATPVTVPRAPQASEAVAGPGQVTLSWQAPASDGGSVVTGYEVFEGTSSGGEGVTPVNASPLTTTGDMVTGLTDGTTYFFTVEAVNAVGAGAPSAEVSATPAAAVTVPGAPTAVQAAAGPGHVSLSWAPPASDGGSAVTGYEVFEGTAPGGEGAAPVNAGPLTTTSDTVTGLTNGTRYFFIIEAVNAVGAGAPSAEMSATPVTVPGAPQALKATRGDATAALTWQAPASDGGSVVTGYDVYRGATLVTPTPLSATARTYTARGLSNGTVYRFTVVALNAAGRSQPSAAVSVTPATVPGAPTKAKATAGASEVVVSWAAPTSDGGSVVTGYDIYEGTAAGREEAKPVNAKPLSAATRSYTVKGLKVGTRYYFEVRAANAVGTGAASAQVSATPVKTTTRAALDWAVGPARLAW